MRLGRIYLFWKRGVTCCGLLTACVACLSAGPMAMGQGTPLPVKPGLWEMTVTVTNKMAMPPEVEARIASMPQAQQDQMRSMMGNAGGGGQPTTVTRKSCLTAQTSMDSLLNQAQQRPGMKCTFSNRVQTSTGASFDMSCSGPSGSATGHSQFSMSDDTHVSSTTHMAVTASSNGHTMNSTVDANSTGKFIGADCGDVKPFTPGAR